LLDGGVIVAPLHFDALAAVRHLRITGVKTVSVIFVERRGRDSNGFYLKRPRA